MEKQLKYLKELAQKTVLDCEFQKEFCYGEEKKSVDCLLPSGDNKYPSFWVRDCIMMLESELVPLYKIETYIEIISCFGQNGENTIYLENGLEVPPFAVADHINFNGRPVFFPGTYSDTENQGNGQFGFYPPFCDNYYFILMIYYYIRQGGDKNILNRVYSGYSLCSRIENAFKSYGIDEKTELCWCESERYIVDWGFTDSVKKSGYLCMASLLRYRAACALYHIFSDDTEKKKYYLNISDIIKNNIKKLLYDEKSGWLYSATEIGKQHDVWSTAYAAYIGILEDKKTYEALKNAYLEKTAVSDGQIRHILNSENFSEKSAWQIAGTEIDTYQNGGYWATATGWYAGALYRYDKKLAADIMEDFINHTKKYEKSGAPFEWINKETTDFSGLNYGTSGVLPYTVWKNITSDKTN